MAERSRLFPLALFVLVIVAASGAAIGATSGVTVASTFPVGDSGGASADGQLDESEIVYLSPAAQDVGQEDYEQTGLDVSSAVAGDVQRLHGNFDKLAFEERQATFDDPDEREAFISETNEDIVDRIQTLDAHSERLIREHNEGELSTGALVREFLRLDIGASQHRSFAEYVNQFSSDDTIPNAVEEELVMLSNPVADELEATARGDEPGRSVYVQTSDDALVLAISGTEHLRQATLRGERDIGGDDQFEQGDDGRIPAAIERTNELYPWASLSSIGTVFRAPGVYQVQMTHDYTDLEIYLDGATTEVFHEIQWVQSTSVPVSSTTTNTTAALELTVEATDPTGPMHVSVVDATTGDPVEATVSIDDQPVGTTDDGELWVTQPRGNFEVTVTTPEGETVTVTGP